MKNLFRQTAKVLLCLMMTAPALSSCYDDSALWESMEEVVGRLDKLEADLSSQADGLASLLSEFTAVRSCVKQADGSYLITLTDDTKFKVLPQGTDFSALMSYVVIEGEKYWAVYDSAGKLEALKDVAGKHIPVSTHVDVELRDGRYYLVINGREYETGFDAEDVVQVFESCTPHADATGNVYALTFSFGDGNEVTVSVDGYKGVIFKIDNAGTTSNVVTDYFIPYGMTQSFLLDVEGVVDYLMQIPAGWKVVERIDEQSGNTYLDVTAPSKELVESGVAFDKGDLKVIAVVEGGDAAVSKLVLSAEPFKSLEFSATKFVAQTYGGVQKFVYGVVVAEEYDEAQVLAKAEELVSTTVDAPKGYAVAEDGVNLTLSEIYGSELDADNTYMLFVVPAMYRDGEDAGFYIDPVHFRSHRVGPVVAKISEPEVTLFDATLSVSVRGTSKMWGGTALKSDDLFESIIYGIVNDIYEPYTEPLSYEGPASLFPVEDANANVEFQPGTTYVTWCVPYDDAKTTYTVDDIVYKEFTTSSLVPGGNLVITASEPEVTTSTITMNISSEGAAVIYYAYLTEDEGKRLGSLEGKDDTKFATMQKSANFTMVRGDEAVAVLEGATPESTMWLYAVAVDEKGNYGTVKCLSAELPKVTFNSMTVTLDSVEVGSDEAEFKVTVSGGTPVSYIYWIGTQQDPFWISCGKSRLSAQKYMAVYPDSDAIKSVMRANGDIASDGTIKITDLRLEEEYVMMVLAQDESGCYSKAGYKKITTLAADLGVVVTEGTAQWEAAKNTIGIEWIEDAFAAAASQGMMARYAFNFSCPQDYTAYVLCASDTYFSAAGLTKMSQIMIEIENYCSRKYDDGHTPYVNGETAMEPDYYKDGVLRDGQMMNVVEFYVHGLPTMGFATYFAPDTHGENNCIHWEDGVDVFYQRALDMIAEYRTLAPYERRAAAFGLTGQEAADWAQALLEAYLPYYEDAEPIINVNDGTPLYMMNPYAMGVNDKGVVPDRVIVMLKDLEGNYFEPMYFEVPDYFTK